MLKLALSKKKYIRNHIKILDAIKCPPGEYGRSAATNHVLYSTFVVIPWPYHGD